MPGGYSFERFRDKLSARIPALPEFRMKLADSVLNLDTPVWVEDPQFDLDRHLHRIVLPAPGTRRELMELAGRLMAERLDRGRPLWDMWVIEGLSGADPDFSGPVAVLHRMHHALGDGVAALDILSRLCSTEADAPPPAPRDGVGNPSRREIALDGLARFARRPWYLVTRALPATIAAVIKIRAVRRAARGQALRGLFSAPRTTFNGNITQRRSMAFVQLDLTDVKIVKDRFGVTVNDVMLALASSALRQFLLDRSELPNAPLVALMPVSVFDPRHAGRNQLSLTRTSLRTDIADPADRLRAIAAASSIAKANSSAIGPTLLQDWWQCAPGLSVLGMRLYRWSKLGGDRKIYNLTLSNVPGPQVQCYLMGATVRARYAFGPVFYGAGLNITVMSLNGNLDVGLVSCSDLLPDLWDLAGGLRLALKELLDASS
jgi:WS/DGAT/MGAT family acyltransferase